MLRRQIADYHPPMHRAGSVTGASRTSRATASLALVPVGVLFALALPNGSAASVFGAVAVVVSLGLAAGVAVSRRPSLLPTASMGLAVAAFAALAAWTLASALWSDSPGRALPDATRTALYVVLLVLGAALTRSGVSPAAALSAMTVAMWLICGAGLLSHLAPEAIGSAPPAERLAEPLGYHNAMALLAAVTLVLSVHWSAAGPSVAARVAGAAGVAVPAATLLLTFSRGGLMAALVGCAAFVVMAFRRRQIPGLIVAGGATAAALVVTYVSPDDSSAKLALLGAIAGISMIAGAIRVRTLSVDERLDDQRAPMVLLPRVNQRALLAAAVLAAGIGLALAFDRLPSDPPVAPVGEPSALRDRLTNVSDNGRGSIYYSVLRGLWDSPLQGSGAGTTQLLWERHGPGHFEARDGHSLYIEALGELGGVGLALVLTGVIAMVGGLVLRAMTARDPLTAAVAAAALAWVMHSAVDYDWEIPATTAWLFMAAGLLLAPKPQPRARRYVYGFPRVSWGIGVLIVAGLAAPVALADRRIADAHAAVRAGDCSAATEAADAARWPIDARSEPHVVSALCAARGGRWQAARAAAERALTVDPANGRLSYLVALTRASTDTDARSALRRARLAIRRDNEIEDFWLLVFNGDQATRRERARALLLSWAEPA